ncbi:cysteine desulfurase family protein [Segetibacter aerophilus]|uniref:cysteine desulfurase n=1 Tax=Segetibacter aerophilus TaxID=670293 RepID=A0A512BGU6_9BACT|nr:cysteine desulfurase family protein [Segetibacter aerophilus]GEO11189.1 cysteine desulfurase [Segetibacter aerophilus]
MNVYFDNAATTLLDEEVFEGMLPYIRYHYGNPSSSHSHGRQARSAVEDARKTIARLLGAQPCEIFFTSGGTEADNTAILSAVRGLDIKHAITSKLEHHAVLNTLKAFERNGEIRVSYILNDNCGNLNLDHLEYLLKTNERSLVSVMHGNNEIGNINDIAAIGEICKKYDAVFHSDTVQTMAHYEFDVSKLSVDFIVGSAHKFHGPKGVGFLYARKTITPVPLINGGSQERHLRAGTENVAGIVGLATALEIAYRNLDEQQLHIEKLKRCCIERLQNEIPGIQFNGNSALGTKSLYTVISTSLPATGTDLLSSLDYNGISASGGSACNSASVNSSHVLAALNREGNRQTIRFSFSKYNSLQEIDFLIEKLSTVCKERAVA